MEHPLVLVLDGDAGKCERLRSALATTTCEVLTAATEEEALRTIEQHPVRVVLASSPPWSHSGGEFLDRATRLRPSIVIVALLDRHSFSGEADAVRAGAFVVAPGPEDLARLRLAVERALAQHDLLEERRAPRGSVRVREGCGRIVGPSEAMERLRERIEILAPGDRPVVFFGEPGTGKRLAARVLHELSPRRGQPFVQVDCAVASAEALEEELFGRGLTPAGAIELARGGTLLLADVDALPLSLQGAVAAAIGGGGRTLSATRNDLARLVEEGRFRADLARALGDAVVEIPPLRARPEDVAALASHFVEEIRAINDLPPTHIAPEALDALAGSAWPGNVRELRTAIEHGMILAAGGTIGLGDLPEALRSGPGPLDAARFREAKRRVVEEFEKRYLGDLLERYHGNVTAAAHHAGMLRSALQRLLRKYDLRSSSFRSGHGERTLD